MTDKVEIDRAMALAVAEALRHGAAAAQIETLREQFKALADDESSTDKIIPG